MRNAGSAASEWLRSRIGGLELQEADAMTDLSSHDIAAPAPSLPPRAGHALDRAAGRLRAGATAGLATARSLVERGKSRVAGAVGIVPIMPELAASERTSSPRR
jgi:hypothetical protein